MNKPRRLILFCSDERFSEYLQPYIESLNRDHSFVIDRKESRDRAVLNRYADSDSILWFDGFDDAVVEASHGFSTNKCRIICRLRGTDFLDTQFKECKWEFFDELVATNPISFEVLRDQFDRVDSFCSLRIAKPLIQLPENTLQNKRHTKNVAYVGPISSHRNSTMLLEWLHAIVGVDPAFKLFIIGSFENFSLQIYFEAMIQKLGLVANIEFNAPPSDWSSWYGDKSFFLSPMLSSGSEAEILRAMAHGLKPIVQSYFGGEHMLESTCFFSSTDELCWQIAGKEWQPEHYRAYVAEHYNSSNQLQQFEDSLSEIGKTVCTPKVSILVPTYNRACMLTALLQELQGQTYLEKEIVIVDDCSSDGTQQVVQEITKNRRDIVYHRNEVNQGNASSMAIAAEKATGEWVLNCSDDDHLHPKALARMVAYAQKKNADVVYCNLSVVDDKGDEQQVWQYRNYYDTYELLRELVTTGGNRIPEVCLIKRELYNQVYTESYARRFINTYYLPTLPQIRIVHLPEALYGYTVHQGSTFSSATGLFDRVKSTQNFINAIMFKYSPLQLFQIDRTLPLTEQIATAYATIVSILLEHGKNYFEGEIYTGARFNRSDNLFRVFYFNAFHWLKQAQKYGLSQSDYDFLANEISLAADPSEFDPVSHGNMPEIYKDLPWFANKPFNNLSSFIAFDLLTVGHSSMFDKEKYTIFREGKAHVWACNHRCRDARQADDIMSRNVITVINIFEVSQLEPVMQHLIDSQLFSTQVFNFTRVAIPRLEMLRNVYNVGDRIPTHFEEYLDLINGLTTKVHYENSDLQTVS